MEMVFCMRVVITCMDVFLRTGMEGDSHRTDARVVCVGGSEGPPREGQGAQRGALPDEGSTSLTPSGPCFLPEVSSCRGDLTQLQADPVSRTYPSPGSL